MFTHERLDIIKQEYDGTGVYYYHDTVGQDSVYQNAPGDSLGEILAPGFFNPAGEELMPNTQQGGIIFITATDGVAIGKLYFGEGGINVQTISGDGGSGAIMDNSITDNKLAPEVKIGSLNDLATTNKDNVVGAVNELQGLVAGLTTQVAALPVAADAVADSTATDVAGLVTDFNALLAKMREAGLIET